MPLTNPKHWYRVLCALFLYLPSYACLPLPAYLCLPSSACLFLPAFLCLPYFASYLYLPLLRSRCLNQYRSTVLRPSFSTLATSPKHPPNTLLTLLQNRSIVSRRCSNTEHSRFYPFNTLLLNISLVYPNKNSHLCCLLTLPTLTMLPLTGRH